MAKIFETPLVIDEALYVRLKGGFGSYLLLASLTASQRDKLTEETGMLLYNSTASEPQIYYGGSWHGTLGASGPTGAASTVSGPSGPTGAASTVSGPTGATSTVSGPSGPAGATGVASTVSGPTGAASTVSGPSGATGAASTVSGPTGAASTVSGPTGAASTVSGPSGPTGEASTVSGPTGAASTVSGPSGPTGAASTVSGPTGAASTVSGPSGPTGAASTVSGPTGAASTVSGPSGPSGPTGAKPSGQLFLSAAGMWPSTTSGCAANAKVELGTNDVDIYVLAFDASSEERAQATIAMPSDWDAGTVTAVFYWTHAATDTNFGVVWGCQGRSYQNDEALDQAFGTAQEVADTGGTTNDLYVSSATSAITLTGAAASELVQFRIYRDPTDGSDTMAIDARLLGVMITYTRS